jgi:hypothetical protein
MGLSLHRMHSGGETFGCACLTGRDHGENEMDMPGDRLPERRAERRKLIVAAVHAAVGELVDGEGDEDGGPDGYEVREAVELGAITAADLVEAFRNELVSRLKVDA